MRAWFLVVAGCWSTPAPLPPPQPAEPAPVAIRDKPRERSHCERAIDHVVGIMQAQIDSDPTLRSRQQQLRDTSVEGCLTTGWSEEALTCYDEAIDSTSLPACFAQLTDEQRDDFNQRIADTLKQPVP